MTVLIPFVDKRLDILDCKRYGNPVVIFRQEIFPDEIDDEIENLNKRVSEVLSRFDHNNDYIALTGSPFFIGLILFEAGKRFRKIRVLRFDRKEHAYYAVEVGHIEENAVVQTQTNSSTRV